MNRRRIKGLTACLLTLVITVGGFCTTYKNISVISAFAYTEKSATVKATSLNVRSGAGTGYSKVMTLANGTSVKVTDEVTGTDGNTWCKITSGANTGYVSKAYLNIGSSSSATYSTDSSFEAVLTSEGFPESYKIYLRQIHAKYPNWTFKAQNTGLSWDEVVSAESVVGRNLVEKSSISSWKSTADGAYNWDSSTWPGFDSDSWVAASEDIIKYYLDPRNFLDETYVFQFQVQTYDSNTDTKEGLVNMLADSFMSTSASVKAATSTDTSTSSSSSTSSTSSSSSSSGPGGSVSETGSGSSTSDSDVSLTAPGESVSSTTIKTNSADKVTTSTYGSDEEVSLEAPGQSQTSSGNSSSGTQQNTSQSEGTEIGPGANLPAAGTGGSTSPGSSSGSSSGSSGSSGAPTLTGATTYVDIITSAASQSGVNPYVLASMIIQEQGRKGTSGLISGSNTSYPGIYNFFNIEAYQSGGQSAVITGLKWASQSGSYGRPWNSIESAIVGGAMYYGDNYVKKGQDTFYLKKFNVQGSNLYKHQYMTNVQGAASEGSKLAEAYTDTVKNTALQFKIPIYSNMPDSPVACPTGDGSPNNMLSSLSVSGYSLTPAFNKNTYSYDLVVDKNTSSINISASPIDSGATVSGNTTVNLSGDSTTAEIVVKAANSSTRTYTIHVARSGSGSSTSSNNPGSSSQTSSSSSSQTSSSSSGSSTGTSQEATLVDGPSSKDTSVVLGP